MYGTVSSNVGIETVQLMAVNPDSLTALSDFSESGNPSVKSAASPEESITKDC